MSGVIKLKTIMKTSITIRINSDDNGLYDFVKILSKAMDYANKIPEAEIEIIHCNSTLVSVQYDIDMHDWDDYDFMINSIAFTFYRDALEKFVDTDFCISKLYEILSK